MSAVVTMPLADVLRIRAALAAFTDSYGPRHTGEIQCVDPANGRKTFAVSIAKDLLRNALDGVEEGE